MDFRGMIIHNRFNKQTIEFISTTDGLQMRSTWDPPTAAPLLHYHPMQEEFFTVEEGELDITINGEKRSLRKGESIHISAGTPHTMWNGSMARTVAAWEVKPALRTAEFLEKVARLSNESKTGRPGVFVMAAILRMYQQEFRLLRPSPTVQKLVFPLLAGLARISGKTGNLISTRKGMTQ